MRTDPITGERRFHGGVDVGGRFAVSAAADGVVKLVGKNYATLTNAQKRRQSGGNTVLIDHDGIVTVYYHGEHQSALVVGNKIRAGQFIFMSGSTGRSTGDHLHFEVRGANGQMGNTQDPNFYLTGVAARYVEETKGEEKKTLEINGELDNTTWKAWQTALKGHGLYDGEIDGLPGPKTYTGVQLWAGVPPTGKSNIATRKAVQRRLGVDDDGIWGQGTVRELQKELINGLAGVQKEVAKPIVAPPIVPKTVPEKVVKAEIPVVVSSPEPVQLVEPKAKKPKAKPMSAKLATFFKMRKNLR